MLLLAKVRRFSIPLKVFPPGVFVWSYVTVIVVTWFTSDCFGSIKTRSGMVSSSCQPVRFPEDQFTVSPLF